MTSGRGSETFAFRVGDRRGESHFLRFSREDERRVDQIEGELAFIKHLADRDYRLRDPFALTTTD